VLNKKYYLYMSLVFGLVSVSLVSAVLLAVFGIIVLGIALLLN